ncbi:hypothetical protein DSCO28_13670 [Desulfosarcina ovata subsp. sediminis]|uniref:PKD domain-containing protein n=1 Tax=Desulfosarcina ovata subsp. sediminis TaxID=885957 RepID=A0A5K7ZIU3_9BACT|nr:thrombospondin type 3 repeat-containing protein [Desulfosarcina ovata]BBO80801.1 hypothetical protein DSCO28_13670 [Desulfosarcina ovata subsp. sediminis]
MKTVIMKSVCFIVTVFALLTIAGTAKALTTTEAQKLLTSDGEDGDSFGISVAIDGDTAIIGAFLDDESGTGNYVGSAYIFTRNGNGIWTEQQKLMASDGTQGNTFGWSVAIDGDTVIIGAPEHYFDYGDPGGAAYVFTFSGSTWTEQQKLTASDGAQADSFGTSVAIDGDTAIIGADFVDGDKSDSGAAYVFTRSGSIWTEQQKLTASEEVEDELFGSSVAIDGVTALIGADAICATVPAVPVPGAAYVFTLSGSTWTEQQKLTASDGEIRDSFGTSVAIDGDTAIIGAYHGDGNVDDQGAAYVFTRSGSIWTEQQKLTASDGAQSDSFGTSVAIDGDTAIIGACHGDGNVDDQGAAYVFTRSGSIWTEQQKLTASDGKWIYFFGASVAIDGDISLIGDSWCDGQKGAVYVFDLDADDDGVFNGLDNCPEVANPDQADSDYDGDGDACDSEFNEETVVEALEKKASTCVDVLSEANPPGVDGMINKISGNGSVANKVDKAVADYTDGMIDTETYLDRLYEALDELDSFDNQLTEKINNGQIVEPEASELWEYSSNMREMINNLISDAMSS